MGAPIQTRTIQEDLDAIFQLATGKGTIGASALSGGGKVPPARGLPGGTSLKPESEDDVGKSTFFVPIAKADDERKTVTGVVLQPEVVDAQEDIISKDVIRDAAHNFLARYNTATKLGLQHKEFKKGRFSLAESYIAPMGFVLNGKTVLEGSWLMVVKVNDSAIWAKVKAGEVNGFSIGGKARVQSLAKKP